MATAAEQPANTAASQARRPGKRALDAFGGGVPMALLALAVTALGFWRTFFAQLGNIDAVHMWHGASATGWLVLVLVQASLISSRKPKLRRRVRAVRKRARPARSCMRSPAHADEIRSSALRNSSGPFAARARASVTTRRPSNG